MLKKFVHHFEEIILLPSFVFSVLLVFSQVIMRYIFHNSLSWSEELARYIFVWQLWIGISYAARNQSHIRIKLIENLIKGPLGRKILESLVIVIWFSFFIFVIYKGWQTAVMIRGYHQVSPAMGLPMFYCYLAIPVGATLTELRLIQNFVNLWRKPADGGETALVEEPVSTAAFEQGVM
ncbi:MAG: TRAP transporter small permease [Clostridiales Family XIII bacterium]|jgi:TRAP-type C4-dicarboxylate transport system permease small subunit|nr:TRAP transporter small permease [Clostridiales Family XIII bacterium]